MSEYGMSISEPLTRDLLVLRSAMSTAARAAGYEVADDARVRWERLEPSQPFADHGPGFFAYIEVES